MTKQTTLIVDDKLINRLTSASRKIQRKEATSPLRIIASKMYDEITRLRGLGYNWKYISDLYISAEPSLKDAIDDVKLRSAYAQICKENTSTTQPSLVVKEKTTAASAIDDLLMSK